jgi:putative ABC transport system permease protein
VRRLQAWMMRVAGTFARERRDAELAAELESHIAMHVEEKVRAGMSPREARRDALMKLGGIEKTKEMCRERWGLPWLETFWQDLRFGARMMRKNPGFTAVVVLTLALGIGANTTIFSIVHAVLLRPLAMKDPSRVVYVQEQWKDIAPGLSVGNFVDVREQSNSFASLCASGNASFNLALTREVSERVQGEVVTASYFETFGIAPILGRIFTSEEDKPGHEQVVVVSERFWRTRLGAKPGAVGQEIRINGVPHTIVGVMPNTFDPLLAKSDVWVPAAYTPRQRSDHDNHYLSVIGRLKDGTGLEAAQSELNVIAQRLQQEYPNDDKDRGLRATSLESALLGDQKLALRMLLGAVSSLLLIVCANIANLQLARARTRQKEIAVRAALGASAKRIVTQLLAENVLLGMSGAVMGIVLAFWGVSWIVANGPAKVPRLDQASVDGAAVAFACTLALFSSVLFGLVPALRSASTRLNEAFKRGADGTSEGGRDGMRSVLVIAEIAMALVLLSCAGLLIRSALLVSRLNPGFDPANLVVGRVSLSDAAYRDPLQARHTFERILEASAGLPGVQAAAVVSRAPMAEGWSSNGVIPEGAPIDPSSVVNGLLQIVSPNYLSTVYIPMKAGRGFTEQDTRDKTLAAIVNERFARTLWPNENPIGKRFACCEDGPKGGMDPVWHEVVGVVGDVRAQGLDRQIQPTFYLPVAQMPPSAWDWLGRTMDVVVRTRSTTFLASELRMVVASVAPGVPVYELSSMKEKIAGRLEESHFDTFLLGLFAGMALLLASVGVYGVQSYLVAQQTRDIGIRMALGATQAQIATDVLGYSLRLIVVGTVVGLVCALGCGRLLSSLLYGIRSNDGIALGVASLALMCVAMLASYFPAQRAMRVDPMTALREE